MPISQTPINAHIPNIQIRPMRIDDYDSVAHLWEHIEGFYIRSVDDSYEGVERFLQRNPNLSVVAEVSESSTKSSGENFGANVDFVVQCEDSSDFKKQRLDLHKKDELGQIHSKIVHSKNAHTKNANKKNEHKKIAHRKIVGSILCGHDGRYGSIYHACVHKDYRLRGIGKAMVAYALDGFRREKISSIALIAFSENLVGNAFWKTQGWDLRSNANRYELSLNTQNTLKKI